ncbi:MAG: MFS transporter [Iphinoe sp. HA4291-MV1]|nr:MFS transporter [Iphinoe sp. HA4291-MV1]
MAKHLANKGIRVFILVWFGQMISVMGSELTEFTLDIWVYQHTGSVTQFAIASVCSHVPGILMTPLAGALADRWNRRWVMILSDSGAGLSTIAIALLFTTDRLEVWHVYIATAISSAFSAFQWPAYSAAIPQLVPKQFLPRANGMTELAESLSSLLIPVLGGVLVVTIHLQGVILIDFATFLFSLVTLLLVRFPNVKTSDTEDEEAEENSLLWELLYGWKYITSRAGLLALLILFSTTNFILGFVNVLTTPLVLSFASPAMLGIILSIDGIGMLLGTLVISTWKGPTRLMQSILVFHLLGGLCIFVTGLRTSVPLIAVAVFLSGLGSQIIYCSLQVIWQRKVAPEVQGRVFAVRRMISTVSQPLAYIVAGPLADRVFEPLMASNGLFASSIGQLIGVGPGRGIGLMFMIMGAFSMLLTVAGYQYPRMRFVEDELSDQIS